MYKHFLLIVTVVTVNGCANPLYLQHQTKSLESQEYFKDRTECKAYANSSAPVTYSASKDSAGNSQLRSGRDKEEWTVTYYECMRGKGWYAVDEKGNRIDYKWCDYIDCF